MSHRPVFSRVVLALVIVGVGPAVFAQDDSGFTPRSGQPGKDVVWVPTPDALVGRMLDLARVTPADYLVDLGSGDGRTVIAAARRGVRALGLEYNPEMVALSQRNAREAGVTNLATFRQADIFESDFSDATVVTMFLLPSLNLRLRPTLLEMKPGTRLVSNSFTMGEWDPDDSVTVETGGCQTWCTAFLWIVPAKVDGTWRVGDETLTLTQEFQMISGTLGSTEVRGRLRGSAITFTAGDRRFAGEVAADAMSGTIEGTPGGTWTARRAR